MRMYVDDTLKQLLLRLKELKLDERIWMRMYVDDTLK